MAEYVPDWIRNEEARRERVARLAELERAVLMDFKAGWDAATRSAAEREAQARAEERARIVAWLRAVDEGHNASDRRVLAWAADRLEEGGV